jgi:hypothetical protein
MFSLASSLPKHVSGALPAVLLLVCGAAHAQTADNNLPSAPVARADVLANVVVLHFSKNSIALGGFSVGRRTSGGVELQGQSDPLVAGAAGSQWSVLPGGNPTRQTIVVAGFRTKITF